MHTSSVVFFLYQTAYITDIGRSYEKVEDTDFGSDAVAAIYKKFSEKIFIKNR